jgi:hypothetical protein
MTWKEWVLIAQVLIWVVIIYWELKECFALKAEIDVLLDKAEQRLNGAALSTKPKPLAVMSISYARSHESADGARWLQLGSCPGGQYAELSDVRGQLQSLSLDTEYRVEIHVLPKEEA